MHIEKPARAPSLRLVDYYLVEAASAFCASLFLLSIFFWARNRFGFSNTENLLLGAVQGLAHIIGSNIGGRLGDRLGYNRVLIAGLCGVTITGWFGWIPDARWMPYIVTGLYGTLIGMTWPALEAGAMHLPGKLDMPQRTGLYNLAWSFSGTAGFAFSGFAFTLNANSIFWIIGTLHSLQLAWIFLQHGRHTVSGETAIDIPHAGNIQPGETKEYFKRRSWLSNSLGYFLAGAFGALTPHLGDTHGLPESWAIWLGSSLLLARAAAFAVLYVWNGWQYSRWWSHYALWSAPVMIAVVFFAGNIWLVLFGCISLGFSFGLSYSKSLYYSLDSSERKGEQGGWHESMIGLGILGGPLAGAIGGVVTQSTTGSKAAIITIACGIAICGYLLLRERGRR